MCSRFCLALFCCGYITNLKCINTLSPRQDGRHFPDEIFKCILLNENVWIPIKISMKFVPKGPINNIPALVQMMAWRRPVDKPLSEPMMVSLTTHICVTRPQWVNVTYLPIVTRVTLLVHRHSPHCPTASDLTRKDMGKIDRCPTTSQHSAQRVNHHHMETFLVLLILYVGNPSSPVASPHIGPMMRSIDVFYVIPSKLLNKHTNCYWFETPWRTYAIVSNSWVYCTFHVIFCSPLDGTWVSVTRNICHGIVDSRHFMASTTLILTTTDTLTIVSSIGDITPQDMRMQYTCCTKNPTVHQSQIPQCTILLQECCTRGYLFITLWDF